jgi:hypothetical protein
VPSGCGDVWKAPGISFCSSTVFGRGTWAVLDVFYLFVAAAGFLVLWGIVKACERV